VKLSLEPTQQIVTINNTLQARVWRGTTDSGIPVQALITRVACGLENQEECERLARELQEKPSPTFYPLAFGAKLVID
jgi:hypothetical protein